MKISDVLWEAACRISNDQEGYTCPAVCKVWIKRGVKFEARKFYKKYFSPSDGRVFWFRQRENERSQNERFFHLLMAYEMAKSEGK